MGVVIRVEVQFRLQIMEVRVTKLSDLPGTEGHSWDIGISVLKRESFRQIRMS